MTEPGAAAGAPAPLTPPVGAAGTLTLTAPEPVAPVVETQAPAMAPQVDPRQLPALDDRVEGYLTALLKNQTRSPEFARQADNVRTMGDADIRKAAARLEWAPKVGTRDGVARLLAWIGDNRELFTV